MRVTLLQRLPRHEPASRHFPAMAGFGEEIDFITRELSQAFGLGGKARPTSDAAERARVNVRRRLKDVIRRVTEQHADTGRYLENTIKTGTYCRYTPM